MLIDTQDADNVNINFKSTHFFGPFTTHFVAISECILTMASCSILEAK